MERSKPTRTKAQVREDALARGQEARYSGKKRQWFFHPFYSNLKLKEDELRK